MNELSLNELIILHTAMHREMRADYTDEKQAVHDKVRTALDIKASER